MNESGSRPSEPEALTVWQSVPVGTHVRLLEVAPRDGLQNSPVLPVSDRVELVSGLLEAGFSDVEVGAFVNPRHLPAMAGTDEVFDALRDVPPDGIRLWAMVASESGARRAVEAGAGGIRVSVTANEEASKRLLNRSVEESFAVVGAVVNAASQLGVPVEVMIATAFGVGASEEPSPAEPVGYACRVLADSGASSVCLGDTTGVASPRRVAALIAEMHEQAVPLESVGMHFHDSRGAGLANVSTALALGIRRFDSAAGGSGGGGYNGLGESGNVASEDVATMLLDLGYETGIDIPRLVATTHKLEDSLGHSLVARVARLEF